MHVQGPPETMHVIILMPRSYPWGRAEWYCAMGMLNSVDSTTAVQSLS